MILSRLYMFQVMSASKSIWLNASQSRRWLTLICLSGSVGRIPAKRRRSRVLTLQKRKAAVEQQKIDDIVSTVTDDPRPDAEKEFAAIADEMGEFKRKISVGLDELLATEAA